MDQNPTQEEQHNNRRRPVEATAAERQNNHPPPQACPRCNSTNTKFCYYNNYSLSQPRFFCKGCRRYWTHGGTLRNVPVGGGCRKSKRPKLSSSPPITATDTDTTTTTVNPSAAVINTSPVYGGGSGGFLSSLAAIQPMNFGPNLGLLHGLGFPGFENHLQPPPPQQEFSFQQLLQERHNDLVYNSTEMGVASSSENWNLLITNNDANNINNDNNHINNNNNNEDDNNNPSKWTHHFPEDDNNNPSKWTHHFPGGSGLDDP